MQLIIIIVITALLIDWCLSGEKGEVCTVCQVVSSAPGPPGKPGESGEDGETGKKCTWLYSDDMSDWFCD